MKTLSILAAMTAILAGSSAYAATVAADQSLGERYESPTLGPVDIYYTGDIPADRPCDTFQAQVVNYDVIFPMFRFGTIKWPLMFSPEMGQSYYSHGKQYCRMEGDKLTPYLLRNTPVWRDAKRGLILDRMTADGTGMEGRAFVQGRLIPQIIASGSDTIQGFVKFELKSCLTDRGEKVTTFSDLNANTTDVQVMIRNLRTRGYRQFLKCSLTVNPKSYDTDTLTDGETVKPGYTGDERTENGFWLVHTSDYLLSTQSTASDRLFLSNQEKGVMVDQFARKGQPRDAAREQVALKAMKDFVSFINNDYANVLYSLNNVKISQGERNEAIRAFFDKNSSKIKNLLGQVDDNYADVSLMNKISMMISVQDSYRTIAKVEKSITSSSPISLDQVVRQY
jgi:hypothetical protein